MVMISIVQTRKPTRRAFGNLPKSQSWFVEETENMKLEPVLLIITSMASQHLVIGTMFFYGVLHGCVWKIGYGKKNIKVLVHEIDQKSLAISNCILDINLQPLVTLFPMFSLMRILTR